MKKFLISTLITFPKKYKLIKNESYENNNNNSSKLIDSISNLNDTNSNLIDVNKN